MKEESKSSWDIYRNDIKNIPSLSASKEQELIRKAQSGDRMARNRVIKSCLKHVAQRAKKYSFEYSQLNDLAVAGNMGLLDAISNFDLKKKYRLITYSTKYIDGAIMDELYKQDLLLPSYKRKEVEKYKKVKEKLKIKLEREPSRKEIAKEMKMTEKRVKNIDLSSGKRMLLEAEDEEGDFKIIHPLEEKLKGEFFEKRRANERCNEKVAIYTKIVNNIRKISDYPRGYITIGINQHAVKEYWNDSPEERRWIKLITKKYEGLSLENFIKVMDEEKGGLDSKLIELRGKNGEKAYLGGNLGRVPRTLLFSSKPLGVRGKKKWNIIANKFFDIYSNYFLDSELIYDNPENKPGLRVELGRILKKFFPNKKNITRSDLGKKNLRALLDKNGKYIKAIIQFTRSSKRKPKAMQLESTKKQREWVRERFRELQKEIPSFSSSDIKARIRKESTKVFQKSISLRTITNSLRFYS